MSPRERLITALDASMDALQLADDRGDEDVAWTEIHHVLGCLYRFEEQKKRSDERAYYRRRGESTDGQIVGGLIWVRGLLLRHDAAFRVRLFKPFAIAGEDTALQPLAYKFIPGRQPVFVDDVHWPDRQHLPAPGRRYKAHQRDAYYDMLVAGEPLMRPLRAARSYFVDER
jgi:hypothetical protein